MPTTKVTVTTLVIIVVALLGFGFIIHMVSKSFAAQCPANMTYNKDLKKCVPTCPAGEKYYLALNACSKCPPGQTFNQGKCTAVACEDDQIVCGTQCISPLTATCVGGKPCPLQTNCVHEYTDSDGNKQCCPNCVGKTKEGKDDCCKEGTHVGDDGTCVPCEQGSTKCGQTCCKADEACCKGQCCPSGSLCDKTAGICCSADKMNTKTGRCCSYEGGGDASDRCCSKDEVAHDGQCKEPCPPSPSKGEKQVFCDPQASPYPEMCRTVTLENKTSYSGCSKRTCDAKVEWHPNPANLYPPNTDSSAGIPVCKSTDDKYWFCQGEGTPAESNLSRDISTTLTPTSEPRGCTEVDCWGQLEPITGSTFDSYDGSSGQCKAMIDCSKNVNTSASCSELLATDKGQPGWNNSIYNPDSASYNHIVSGTRDVVCMTADGKPTGQICPEYKTCDSQGNCLSPYVLAKDGTLNPGGQPTTVSCRQKTSADSDKGLAQYSTLADCQAALKEQPCPQGFARAGTDPNSLQCYRYGFPEGWNPGTWSTGVPCQLPAYQSNAGRMDVDYYTTGFFETYHPYCTDKGTVVPEGAYYCRGDWGDRGRDGSLIWMQCGDPAGCTMTEDEGTPYGQRYSFDDDHSSTDIGFCVDPGYGNSPTKIPHP